MNKKWFYLNTGFALFSMFFGSGNLVFPLVVGRESGGHYLMTALGFLLTGVLVPFLGVMGMLLHEGSIVSFFSCFGKKGTFLFCLLALSLMGPFGVLARCLTVTHGALLLLIPQLSLPLTSGIACVIIYLLAVNKSKIVTMLGIVLTPFLLGSIAIIAFFGLRQVVFPMPLDVTPWAVFKMGFLEGYQTMDLLAAFFFSQFIINHLYQTLPNHSKSSLFSHFYKSSLIGMGLLSLVYLVLILLGWLYSPFLFNMPAQELLGIVAFQSLGNLAAPVVCLAVTFACLTTAIVLASLFAEFLNTEVTQKRLGNKISLLITLLIGFFVSTFDFAGIAKFLSPILETIYPALIFLTLFNIITKLKEKKASI